MEEKFVKMFIKKQYQERLLFEFNSKKREKAIDRFSHEAKNVLKENLILMQAVKKKYGITIVNKNKLIIFATKLRNRKYYNYVLDSRISFKTRRCAMACN